MFARPLTRPLPLLLLVVLRLVEVKEEEFEEFKRFFNKGGFDR
jgi:hypothetical protein